MNLKNRIDRLETLHEAAKPAAPALIVRTSVETEAEAITRYTALHGHPPPAGTPVIHVTRLGDITTEQVHHG